MWLEPELKAEISYAEVMHGCAPVRRAYSSQVRGTLMARTRGVVVWIVLACLLIFMVWALLLHVLNLG